MARKGTKAAVAETIASDVQLITILEKLADLPDDPGKAEASIQNASLWISYYRRLAALYGIHGDVAALSGCQKELRDWEQRKSAAERVRESDRLDECLHRMLEIQNASNILEDIATEANDAVASVEDPCEHIAVLLDAAEAAKVNIYVGEGDPVRWYCNECEVEFNAAC